MSKRWQYKVVEIKMGMMGSVKAQNIQEELDKAGAQGWELVNLTFNPWAQAVLVFKREH